MAPIIAVRVTPRSSKPGIRGWRKGPDGREEVEVHVAAAPTDGAANDAVIAILAKALGASRSEVSITAGHTSRHKRLSVPLERGDVMERLGGERRKD